MSEGDPINPFRFRRVPLDVQPHTGQFIADTLRMDEILDDLSQETLKPDSVTVSAFTPLAYPKQDRPITEDDYLLLMEIVRLRVDLTRVATENTSLLKKVRPAPLTHQNPRG